MSVSARDEILKLQPFGKQIDFLLKTKTNIWVYHNAYLFIAINAIILNAHTKAEYSSWFFRFMITPSAMDSFSKTWEKFCDLSNWGSRVVARIDWGLCLCAIISGVVELPLPLKTPARARTAKPSSVITYYVTRNETKNLPDTFLPMFVHTACPPRCLSWPPTYLLGCFSLEFAHILRGHLPVSCKMPHLVSRDLIHPGWGHIWCIKLETIIVKLKLCLYDVNIIPSTRKTTTTTTI